MKFEVSPLDVPNRDCSICFSDHGVVCLSLPIGVTLFVIHVSDLLSVNMFMIMLEILSILIYLKWLYDIYMLLEIPELNVGMHGSRA